MLGRGRTQDDQPPVELHWSNLHPGAFLKTCNYWIIWRMIFYGFLVTSRMVPLITFRAVNAWNLQQVCTFLQIRCPLCWNKSQYLAMSQYIVHKYVKNSFLWIRFFKLWSSRIILSSSTNCCGWRSKEAFSMLFLNLLRCVNVCVGGQGEEV